MLVGMGIHQHEQSRKPSHEALPALEVLQSPEMAAVESKASVVPTLDQSDWLALTHLGVAKEKVVPNNENALLSHYSERSRREVIFSMIADRLLDICGPWAVPKWLQAHLPVYRAIEENYAGTPNASGCMDWAIGRSGLRRWSVWMNEPHKVVLSSTLGILKSVDPTVQIDFDFLRARMFMNVRLAAGAHFSIEK